MSSTTTQLRPKKRVNAWSEFDIQLIDFVKERPDIYDSKDKLKWKMRAEIINKLFKEFAGKWNISVNSCKTRWWSIKRNYIAIKLDQNKKVFAYKKYIDGRLSFLDALIDRYKKNIEETAAAKTNKRKETREILIEYYYNMGIIENREKFTEFEELLINFVKNYPVLYDPRISLNIKKTSREKIFNDLWEKLRVDAGESVPDCQTTWNKINMEYYRVRSVKENHQMDEPCFLKYFDEKFDFLKPMYLLVKDAAMDVFHAESIEKVFEQNYSQCTWDDFQLAIIDYVQENPIIYDDAQHKTSESIRLLRDSLWCAFAAEFKLNFRTASRGWCSIKTLYRNFLQKLTDLTVLNSLPLRHLRYQKLSFLNKVLLVETAPCKEVSDLTSAQHTCTVTEEIDNLCIQHEYGDDDDFKKEMSMNLKTEEETNLYDSMLEVEDNFVGDKILVSLNDEPKPSTSANINRPTEKSSERINFTTSDDNERGSVENNIKSKKCVQEPTSMLNHHNLSTFDFFREIGRIVTENFGQKKQRHIRMKSWSLVTKLELAMLLDDDTPVPTFISK